MPIKSNIFLRLSTVFLVAAIGAFLAIDDMRGADFAPGSDWQRQRDYVAGADEGDPSRPTAEAPWLYAWGKDAPDQWESASASPLLWQSAWFGHPPGVWAMAKDRLPMVDRQSLSLAVNAPKSAAVAYLCWRNPTGQAVTVKIAAALKVSWHGKIAEQSADFPLHVVVFVQGADGVQLPRFFEQIVSDPDSPVSIDANDVKVPANGDVVFGFKPEKQGNEGYVSVGDEITIQLVSAGP